MIREVVLRRFKQFANTTLSLSGHVVLAGQNNSGKTTVLQALSAWSLAYEQWRTLNDIRKHNGAYARKPITKQAFSPVPLRSFELLWQDRRYEGNIEVEVATEDGWRLAMQFEADSTDQIYVRPVDTTERATLQQPSPSMVYVSSVDGLEIEEPAINNPDWIRTLLGRQRPGTILRNLLLEVSRGNRWDELRASVRKLFGIELLVPQTPGGQIVCEFQSIGKAYSLDVLNAGSGLHQVLLLLACLYTRAGSVLLIDEPDAHLHVYLQDTIFSEIKQVAAKTNSQVILATHSEVIFRSVPPESLIIMMGQPRRLASVAQRAQLAEAMGLLEQVDVINAISAPGVLYCEGFTDLNLLRSWAEKLHHPTVRFFDREPFWKPQVWETREDAPGIKAQDHFNALKLIRDGITGVWLIDADGRRRNIQPTQAPQGGALNRLIWSRYETESYLVHPAALARFIDTVSGAGGADAVREYLTEQFNAYLGANVGAQVATEFIASPLQPPQAVNRYLEDKKARTEIISGLLQHAGIHGFDYTRFNEIAALMQPGEIHPEVTEKLDFIQRAFGL